MSNTKSAISGLFFATIVGALGVLAAGWFGMSYHYGNLRHEVAKKVVATADWQPKRVAREDATADCAAANMREEAERLLSEVDVFEVSKVERFDTSPSAQRARELARSVRAMEPASRAFLEAYACKEVGRLSRSGREQQLSGPILTKAVGVAIWNDPERAADLRKLLWVGRDVQATPGIYEFMEGAEIMEAAYKALAQRLPSGELDRDMDPLMAEITRLMANEESAQLHWRAGARVLLGDLLGPDWDANPPTPMHAKQIVESMDEILASLEEMPNLASAPYPKRHEAMSAWIAQHDLSAWGPKFAGYGEAGVTADAMATHAHAYGRALLIGAAIRKYRRTRGVCPRELSDLEGGILEKVPLDPIAAAPFTYDSKACTITSAKTPTGLDAVVVQAKPE
ncbi:MAG: hypothetical protein H6736_06510 [Alphaproteobacteria bacterium]|nr:hypothetical protein [Alphaproteobacteria bacterium]MCB9691447.1 hypothetical protein [Alphaproteobacteria bacterium]